MRALLLLAVLPLFLLAGCCGSTPSGSCPYGTYGESCTRVCNAMGGGEGCFTQCMDGVRAEGLGDATTCCKETLKMNCENMCRQKMQPEDLQDCFNECAAVHQAAGIPDDICYMPL